VSYLDHLGLGFAIGALLSLLFELIDLAVQGWRRRRRNRGTIEVPCLMCGRPRRIRR
jgi:hypothetical protein